MKNKMESTTRDDRNNEDLCEFGKPVESIMRCDDFKSNFARRLSNRYTARSPAVTLKHDLPLKPVDKKTEETPHNTPKTTELHTQLSERIKIETCKSIKESSKKGNMRIGQLKETEIMALEREVDLLKWQLAQTEANRQMQIALLSQLVNFLDRVKVHMESRKKIEKRKSSRLFNSSFNTADLPRSVSVMNINKMFSCNSPNISKSISDNGFTESHALMNQSKLYQDTESKIPEEITRLITLANSVMNTKLPDLTCHCDDMEMVADFPDGTDIPNSLETDVIMKDFAAKDHDNNTFNDHLGLIEEALSASFTCDDSDLIDFDRLLPLEEYIDNGENYITEGENISSVAENNTVFKNKANYAEDESGFSSMTSFQEIGIPVINVTPPTPEKKSSVFPFMTFSLLDELEMGNTNYLDDEQAMNVFWV